LEPEVGPAPSLAVPRLAPEQRLVSLSPLYLSGARRGETPRLATAVRVGQRGGRLLVRFDGKDDGVVATHRRRDAPLYEEDVYEVFVSAQETPRVYYEFEINPLGTLFDARVTSPDGRRATMTVDTSWDAPGLRARAGVRGGSWWARFSIPLAAIDASGAARLRGNFYRIDRGAKDEHTGWSPTLADPPDFHVPDRFGVLELAAPPAA
jgi:hypothetical protein